jgi:AAA+ superfamily predicted ATPase
VTLTSKNIETSIAFLVATINARLAHFFKQNNNGPFIYPHLQLQEDNESLTSFLARHQFNLEEYIILLLSLAPHLEPNFLDTIIQQYLPNGGDFPEIGGVKGNKHRGTIPTGDTALFIIAGSDINKRLEALRYFSPDHFFAKENILLLEPVKNGEPKMSGRLILQDEYVDLLTTGTVSKPTFGPDFPAKLITTKMDWEDVILNSKTAQSIHDMKLWVQHNDAFMNEWGMSKKIKPGFRALFYGPPGTGKTLTATLLGKHFNKEVYRIDLSQVVSKYIGETEKNLEKVFTKAEHKDWILFFDEADALFGKRSNVQNAHDKYANQEVSYLLQRVEDFPGIVILASNFKSNLDAAFIRRFNAIIHFPMPEVAERVQIWKCSLPSKATLAEDVDINAIARKFELSGSAIVSAIHYASLQTISKNSTVISKDDIFEGIKKEYQKEERVFSN